MSSPVSRRSYDDALAETVDGRYKAELIKRHGLWRSVEEVELATAEWVHCWNTRASIPACGDDASAEFVADCHSGLADTAAA